MALRPWFETVTDLTAEAELLRRRPYGVIEVIQGRFRQVRLRPFPKHISLAEIVVLGRWHHRRQAGDRCLLYYNQPRRFGNILTLKYVFSARDTSFRSFHRAVEALDEIARIKGSDALLCDVANWRISDRLLARWGWEPHCPTRFHRHYIKRFYGDFPPPAPWISGDRASACPALEEPVAV